MAVTEPSQVELPSTASIESSTLYNDDLRPIPIRERHWTTYNYAALWMGIAHGIPTYYLASGLIELGMSWVQAVMTIGLGNIIVLGPILLNSHAGAKYGIPFPVFGRSVFGVLGANVPALLRAVSACGWFGIQTWVGGQAIFTIAGAFFGPWWSEAAVLWGYPWPVWLSFAIFWLLQIGLIWRGIESIRRLENLAAPLILIVAAILLGWMFRQADGLGPMASAPSELGWGAEFWKAFAPALMGMIAYFATMSINICDFTRFSRGQRQQAIGQSVGLPPTMIAFSTIGALTTSATIEVYGEPIWDPIHLVAKFSNPFVILVSLVCVVIATLAVNVAANTVGPAYDFSNAFPRLISFRVGGVITGLIGIAIQPWRLLSSADLFIHGWLGVTGAVLGGVAGVMVADYWILRRRRLRIEDLYLRGGLYEFARGFNWRAIATLGVATVLAVGGAYSAEPDGPFPADGFIPVLQPLFDYNWAVAFLSSIIVYLALTKAFWRNGAEDVDPDQSPGTAKAHTPSA